LTTYYYVFSYTKNTDLDLLCDRRLIMVYMYIKYEFKIYHVVQREMIMRYFSLLSCIIYREISRL